MQDVRKPVAEAIFYTVSSTVSFGGKRNHDEAERRISVDVYAVDH